MLRTVKLVLLYFAYQLVCVALMMGVSRLVPMDYYTQLGWSLLLSGGLMCVHLVAFGHVQVREAFRSPGTVNLLLSIACVVGAMCCGNALSELFALPDWLESDFNGLSRSVTGVLSVALVAPLCEELLFRGAVMRSLRESGRSPRAVILLSALVFGVIHFNPNQVLFAFLMGLVLGWIAWRTQSLLPVVIGHILNNSLGVMEMAAADGQAEAETYSTAALWGTVVVGLVVVLLTARALHRRLPVNP